MSKPFWELTPHQQQEFYKAWIRRKPCCWCGTERRISSYNPHATSDYRVVPLCAECHERYHHTWSLSGLDRGPGPLVKDQHVQDTRDFLQRAIIDNLVEFMETMLNPEML